jgi:hypothetical protein
LFVLSSLSFFFFFVDLSVRSFHRFLSLSKYFGHVNNFSMSETLWDTFPVLTPGAALI